jgi:hypothetical protein
MKAFLFKFTNFCHGKSGNTFHITPQLFPLQPVLPVSGGGVNFLKRWPREKLHRLIIILETEHWKYAIFDSRRKKQILHEGPSHTNHAN